MSDKYNDHFIATLEHGDFEVAIPPFLVGLSPIARSNQVTLYDALDVGLHYNVLSESEIDAAHRLISKIYNGLPYDTVFTNSEITTIARCLCLFSEEFPERHADILLSYFRAYVSRNKHEFFPGG